jgi:hypothetical protein
MAAMSRDAAVVAVAVGLVVLACGTPRPGPAGDPDGGSGPSIYVGSEAPDKGVCAYSTQPPPDFLCTPGPDDEDGDGYTVADGDCDDHDCAVNPGAYDVPGNGKDDDCSGAVDDEPTACDEGIALAGDDVAQAVKALGLCRTTTEAATGKDKTWGVLSARWTTPAGGAEVDPLSRGILPAFGAALPREGARMVALSSGTARAPGQPGWISPQGYDKGYVTGAPAGYPTRTQACPGIDTGAAHDGEALEVTIRVPTNARGLSFDELFYTFEYPDYICTRFNDYFVTMLTPQVPGLPDGNISFDQKGNPVSVNNALLYVCKPQRAGGKTFTCPLGTSLLAGTGFEASAATGWITTVAPIARGSIVTLLFAIWDSSDGLLDSTVLLDKFAWTDQVVRCAQTNPVSR